MSQNSQSRLFGDNDETIYYFVTECSKETQNGY